MKRKTTRHHRKSHQSVLHARVITKRTVWFGFLKLTGQFVRLAIVLTLVAAAGWGIWRGIQHAFYQNPDFVLRIIDLNENPTIDEIGVAETAGIDLSAENNLFQIDTAEVARKLKNLPEISDAHVERRPPSTLFVRVTPRTPAAWITSSADSKSQARKSGGMLVDHTGIAFPCPPQWIDSLVSLPVIELTTDRPLTCGQKIELPELAHCFELLDAARDADPESLRWIDSIRRANSWSLLVKTRQGTTATFGLGDHARQFNSLRAALDHAGDQGYTIDTINLIPKYNIPITVRDEASPPKATPVSSATPPDQGGNRRSHDLNKILNRN